MSEKLSAFLTALLLVCAWGSGLAYVLSLGFMYAGVFPSQELAYLIHYGFLLSALGAVLGSLVVRDAQTKAIRFPLLIGWRRGDDRGRFGVVWREVWRALRFH